MKRLTLGLAALSLAAALAAVAPAEARTYFGFQIDLGNAPPPPAIVYHRAPAVEYMREPGVYVVRDREGDFDVFRDGPYWYSYSNGWWYRARSYRGPFAVVDVRLVPRQIFMVPAERWRHYPPHLASMDRRRFSERERGSWRDWDDEHMGDRGGDHGQGRNDNGQGRGNHGNHGNH